MSTTAVAETPQATATNNMVEETNFSGWEAEGRWTAKPIRLSASARRLLVSQFTPEALHQLAYLMTDASPGMIARRRLNETSLNAWAEMIMTGKCPTVGWWVRNGGGDS